MKKLIMLAPVLALSACMYGNPANYERYFGNADISQIDWTRVDAEASACQYNWFGFIPTGNRSVARAVEQGNIARIAYIDSDTVVLFPLFIAECTNVYGERTVEARERDERIAAERAARRAARNPRPPIMQPVSNEE
ncbi:MAG: TRL-like family protein [Alphaproteobacteria bacterium]|nr:TRL-like family protein [Alphaproteobacteria bacterium]MCL2757901.1 TRL-like family protein [Alphaproteobacteria bacterium]